MPEEYLDVKSVDRFYTNFNGSHTSVNTIFDIMKTNKYGVIEIMARPAYVDEALCDISDYIIQRTKELSILIDHRLKKYIDLNCNIKLAT